MDLGHNDVLFGSFSSVHLQFTTRITSDQSEIPVPVCLLLWRAVKMFRIMITSAAVRGTLGLKDKRRENINQAKQHPACASCWQKHYKESSATHMITRHTKLSPRLTLGTIGGFKVPLQSPSQLNPSNHLNTNRALRRIKQNVQAQPIIFSSSTINLSSYLCFWMSLAPFL